MNEDVFPIEDVDVPAGQKGLWLWIFYHSNKECSRTSKEVHIIASHFFDDHLVERYLTSSIYLGGGFRYVYFHPETWGKVFTHVHEHVFLLTWLWNLERVMINEDVGREHNNLYTPED